MILMNLLPVYRALLCFSTLLLILLYIVNAVLAIQQNHRKATAAAVFGLIGSYAMHEALKSVIFFQAFGRQEGLAESCGRLSAWFCLAVILALFFLGFFLFHWLLTWKRGHISPTSVKESIDHLPSGLAIYEENGSCLLVNHTMNALSVCLTGHAVVDGRILERAAQERNMLVDMDDRSYQISHRRLPFEKRWVHELVADDVTELHQKTQALSRSNAELADMARKMKQYSLSIDESVRRQEILQAKIKIHDEMNRLLLATGNAAGGNVSDEELQTILRTWKSNALLLCKEADREPAGNTWQDLQTLADIIGIRIRWDGSLKACDSQILQLFERASREAVNNAVKHAKATCLYVKIRETDKEIRITYTNNGSCPKGRIRPSGGLKNLQSLLERAGGHMSLTSDPAYTLTITIPKGDRGNAI